MGPKKTKKKIRYPREMGRSLKNVKKHGYSAQKIDKIQNRAKIVKKRQNTREIEIQYIYIWGNPISRGSQTSVPDDGRSFLARVLRLRSILG